MSCSYWLDPIPENLRAMATKALDDGNPDFIRYAPNTDGMDLVLSNIRYLRERGIFEQTLADAYLSTRTNLVGYSTFDLLYLFCSADRAKLLACGDPLPDGESFTVYRGVAGKGRYRKVNGISWTASPEKALWFATRYPWLVDPAVYQATMRRQDIFLYTNDRNEQEFVGAVMGRPRRYLKPIRRLVTSGIKGFHYADESVEVAS